MPESSGLWSGVEFVVTCMPAPEIGPLSRLLTDGGAKRRYALGKAEALVIVNAQRFAAEGARSLMIERALAGESAAPAWVVRAEYVHACAEARERLPLGEYLVDAGQRARHSAGAPSSPGTAQAAAELVSLASAPAAAPAAARAPAAAAARAPAPAAARALAPARKPAPKPKKAPKLAKKAPKAAPRVGKKAPTTTTTATDDGYDTFEEPVRAMERPRPAPAAPAGADAFGGAAPQQQLPQQAGGQTYRAPQVQGQAYQSPGPGRAQQQGQTYRAPQVHGQAYQSPGAQGQAYATPEVRGQAFSGFSGFFGGSSPGVDLSALGGQAPALPFGAKASLAPAALLSGSLAGAMASPLASPMPESPSPARSAPARPVQPETPPQSKPQQSPRPQPNTPDMRAAQREKDAIQRDMQDLSSPGVKMFAILQNCTLAENKNKFYVLELHRTEAGQFEVLTHWGRTDDLERAGGQKRAGQAGKREFGSAEAAQRFWEATFREKTGRKGYVPVSLASAKVGSAALRAVVAALHRCEAARLAAELGGGGGGDEDDAQAEVPAEVLRLVEFLFAEAEAALTSALSARITERGIETPLGAVTLEQVRRGEQALDAVAAAVEDGAGDGELLRLSGELFSVIPHRLGRSRQEALSHVLRSPRQVDATRELLQLMRDMIALTGAGGGAGSAAELKYRAMRTVLRPLESGGPERAEVAAMVAGRCARDVGLEVQDVFAVRRGAERRRYDASAGNEQLVFHGSRASNIAGILSRGLLLPHAVVRRGGQRTNVGWLGAGLYFSAHACTSTRYASPSSSGARMLLVNRVALGRAHDVSRISPHLEGPPAGCHSVRGLGGDFEDEELVVYDEAQQRMEYLVVFRASDPLPPPGDKAAALVSSSSPDGAAAPAPAPAPAPQQKKRVKKKLLSAAPVQGGGVLPNITATLEQPKRPKQPKQPKAYHVMEDWGKTWHAALAMPEAGKFYELQILAPDDADAGLPFELHTRWGRVGANQPQAKMEFATKALAQQAFCNKFLAKTRNDFMVPQFVPQPGKYVLASAADVPPAAPAPAAAAAPAPAPAPAFSFGGAPAPASAATFGGTAALDAQMDAYMSAAPAPAPASAAAFGGMAALNAQMDAYRNAAPAAAPTLSFGGAVPTGPSFGGGAGAGAGSFGGGRQAALDAQMDAYVAAGPAGASADTGAGAGDEPGLQHTPPVGSDQENAWILSEETRLRRQFASAPESVGDAYAHLLSVHAHYDTFRFMPLSAEEQQHGKVLAAYSDPGRSGPSVSDRATFERNLRTFSGGQLEGLDWSGVFMAGGCVLACLMPDGGASFSDGFKGSDIDLFLHGLPSQDAAAAKVRAVYETIKRNRERSGVREAPEIVRTAYAVTVLGQHPFRPVQIVLRLYQSPAAVLLGFDIDACTVGFDGRRAVATPRARRALNKQVNLVDLSRRSLTYETRLHKYSRRGFAVLVPGLRLERVRAEAFQQRAKDAQGLGKLLALHRREQLNVLKLAQGKAKPRGLAFATPKKQPTVAAAAAGASPESAVDEQESDYNSVLIPYGPQWFAWNTLAFLKKKDVGRIFAARAAGGGAKPPHEHIVVAGLEGVLTGRAPWCAVCQRQRQRGDPPQPRSAAPRGGREVVVGEIAFVDDDPGRQLLTGSFHPLPAADWDRDVYLPAGAPDAAVEEPLSFTAVAVAAGSPAAGSPAAGSPAGASASPVRSVVWPTRRSPAKGGRKPATAAKKAVPRKKATVAKKAVPRKVKEPESESSSESSSDSDSDSDDEPHPKLKTDEQTFGDLRLLASPEPSVICAVWGAPPANARRLPVTAFDMDGTLIQTRSGRKFPTDAADWRWFAPEVPDALRAVARRGHRVAIVSNQLGIAKGRVRAEEILQKIAAMLEEVGPAVAGAAVLLLIDDDHMRKPSPLAWELLQCDADPALCTYVGDAAGRPGDFAGTDLKFALNAGLGTFATPEEFFQGAPAPAAGERERDVRMAFDLGALRAAAPPAGVPQWPVPGLLAATGGVRAVAEGAPQELLVLVGPPASGKSTLARRHLEPRGYVRVNFDDMGEGAARRLAKRALAAGCHVVVDNNNYSAKQRAPWVQLAREHGARARCVVVAVDKPVARHANRVRAIARRAKPVPAIAVNVFYSRFEQPEAGEGFEQVATMPYRLEFGNEMEREAYFQWTEER